MVELGHESTFVKRRFGHCRAEFDGAVWRCVVRQFNWHSGEPFVLQKKCLKSVLSDMCSHTPR